MLKEGFWTVIVRAAPTEPNRPCLPFAASLDYLTAFVNAEGFPASSGVVGLALRSAKQWNPSFPWKVTERSDGWFEFAPRIG